MPSVEKRYSKRYHFNKPIQYAFLSSDTFFNVQTINVSKDGLCFQTGYEIKPQKHIYIKEDVLEPNRNSIANAVGHFAEVRWCRKVPGKSAFFYWVGVKYETLESH